MTTYPPFFRHWPLKRVCCCPLAIRFCALLQPVFGLFAVRLSPFGPFAFVPARFAPLALLSPFAVRVFPFAARRTARPAAPVVFRREPPPLSGFFFPPGFPAGRTPATLLGLSEISLPPCQGSSRLSAYRLPLFHRTARPAAPVAFSEGTPPPSEVSFLPTF